MKKELEEEKNIKEEADGKKKIVGKIFVSYRLLSLYCCLVLISFGSRFWEIKLHLLHLP